MSTETTTPQPQAATPKRGLILATVLVATAAGTGAGAFALGPVLVGNAAPVDSTVDSSATVADSLVPPGETPIVIQNLVLNPAESRGTRFLLIGVGFEFAPAVATEEFAARETEIRDRVMGVLSTKTVDELVDYTRRDGFRREISIAVDSILGAGRTRRVFFPQFVIQ